MMKDGDEMTTDLYVLTEHERDECWFGQGYYMVEVPNGTCAYIGKSEIPKGTIQAKKFARQILNIPHMLHQLDRIHDLPVDDEGNRTIPPDFLDGVRDLLKLI